VANASVANASVANASVANASVLRGVEPGVLAELYELAGSVAGVTEEQFAVQLVAAFNDPLGFEELRHRTG
jgi:hypothetical protein